MSLYLYCVTEHVAIFILNHGTCRYICIVSWNIPLYLYCVTEHLTIFILCHGTCHYIYIESRNMSLYLYCVTEHITIFICPQMQLQTVTCSSYINGTIIIAVFKIKQILYNFRVTSPPHPKWKIPGALLLLPFLLLKLFEPLTSLFLFLLPQLQILNLIIRTDHNCPKYMWLGRGEFPIKKKMTQTVLMHVGWCPHHYSVFQEFLLRRQSLVISLHKGAELCKNDKGWISQ